MSYTGTPTLYGERQIAAAYQSGQRLPIVSIAVGDGNGAAVTPTEGMTGLVNEVWRGAITSWGVDPTDPRRIVVHTTIPATAGPFTVREGAIFDASGGMVAITALATTEIVAPGTSNQATALDLTIALPIGSAGAITVSPGQGERILTERLIRTPFISINSASTQAPPASPAVGDLYIVPQGATGAWATMPVGSITEWNGTFWATIAPPLKMVAGIMDAPDDGGSEYIKWNGAAWEPFAADGVVFTVVDAAGASTSDELVGTAAPGLSSLLPNMLMHWRSSTANQSLLPKGNITNSAGVALGDVQFTKRDGSPLAAGDIPGKADFLTAYDGVRHRLFGLLPSDVLALIAANAPRIVTAPTLFVAPPGTAGASDSNPGTQAAPLATLAGMYALAARLIVIGGLITAKLMAPSVYAPASPPSSLVTPVVIQGDNAAQDSYFISGAGISSGVLAHSTPSSVTYQGLTLNNTSSATNLLAAAYGGTVTCNFVTFSATGNANSQSAMIAFSGGSITLGSGCKCSANFSALWTLVGGSITGQVNGDLTFVGNPSFGTATAYVDSGTLTLAGFKLTGTTSGNMPRFVIASTAGHIVTGGGGPNYIPGGSAGVVSNVQYS